MPNYRQLFSQAERQQLLADQLAQGALRPRAPQQTGRIAPSMGFGEGIAQLGEALLARRAGKRAASTQQAAETERAKAQAAALARMSGQQDTSLGPTEPINPFATSQEALESGVDPNVVSAYLKRQQGGDSPFGVVDPGDFTPDSLAKFAQTKNWADLIPVNKTTGRYTPSQYTPESWAEFMTTNDPAVLVARANIQFRETPGGGVVGLDPITGQQTTTPITPQQGTQQAAERARQIAAATAEGEAAGGREAKQPALDSLSYVMDQFYPALANTPTGGTMGYKGLVGGVTDYQDAQRFDNLREQLSTELRTVFRIPGEGTLSDQEQKQYGLQLPGRNMDEAGNRQILRDLMERARLRLQSPVSGEGLPPAAPSTGKRFVFDPMSGQLVEQ